jgi:hypothetical protein
MSKGIESVLIIRQKIIVLRETKPTMVKGVIIAIRVRYIEIHIKLTRWKHS